MTTPSEPLCEHTITYIPLGEEPDPSLCASRFPPPQAMITQNKSQNPFEKARSLAALMAGKRNVCILVPGTRFDATGTRHGRGGGWYDRFLARVPKTWIRIGVAAPKQYSPAPLKRKTWDEPMDWVLIVFNDTVEYIKTNARKKDVSFQKEF